MGLRSSGSRIGLRVCGLQPTAAGSVVKDSRDAGMPGKFPAGEGPLVVAGWGTRQAGVMGTSWQERHHEPSLGP